VGKDYAFELDRVQISPESWGLDRLDEESLPMDNQYHYEQDGSGVDVYILDTGIYRDHIDFSTFLEMGTTIHSQHRNISCGYDAFQSIINATPTAELCIDTIGHGTHIAGIIGGIQNGVAKHTNLISVKVYDVDKGASLSTVLAGLDFILSQNMQDPTRPTVVNLSLGGPRCELMNLMAKRLVEDVGVVMVVSAGNDASTSCDKSPASAGLPIITVSTTDHVDSMPRYANCGECTNLLAPGHAITSAWIRHPHDVVRLSGTSFAAAHVTGGMFDATYVANVT
jgi:subtilisin family serine protease